MKITAADARAVGICKRMRAWFRKNNIDWNEFCTTGIELDALLAVGDQHHNIETAARAAKRRLDGQE